jgi:hypothetical protein
VRQRDGLARGWFRVNITSPQVNAQLRLAFVGLVQSGWDDLVLRGFVSLLRRRDTRKQDRTRESESTSQLICVGVHGTVLAYRPHSAGSTAIAGAAGQLSTSPFQGALQPSSSSSIHGEEDIAAKPDTETDAGTGDDSYPTADAPAVRRGGLRGWRAVKVVVAGPKGWSEGRRPHNVRTEAAILVRMDHPNVSAQSQGKRVWTSNGASCSEVGRSVSLRDRGAYGV